MSKGNGAALANPAQVTIALELGSQTQILSALLAAARSELGADGRILLRPSGTEELVRVMVEAPTESQAVQVAQRVADVVEAQ